MKKTHSKNKKFLRKKRKKRRIKQCWEVRIWYEDKVELKFEVVVEEWYTILSHRLRVWNQLYRRWSSSFCRRSKATLCDYDKLIYNWIWDENQDQDIKVEFEVLFS